MISRVALLALFAVAASVSPALAEESHSLARQILVMWFPLILIIGLWLFFIRLMHSRFGRTQRAVIERYPAHMDALERKLDRIIELLESR
jgi:ABC-type branched-subunit amino acid transport system permease subunit